MSVSIRIIRQSLDKRFGKGRIRIGDFSETFLMSFECWSAQDYKRQWKEGLERIKHNDRSCLVASVQDPLAAPLINWWVLYKEGNIVYIHNQLIVDSSFKVRIDDKPFTPENCYEYIKPYRVTTVDGYKVSEWSVRLDEIETLSL